MEHLNLKQLRELVKEKNLFPNCGNMLKGQILTKIAECEEKLLADRVEKERIRLENETNSVKAVEGGIDEKVEEIKGGSGKEDRIGLKPTVLGEMYYIISQSQIELMVQRVVERMME